MARPIKAFLGLDAIERPGVSSERVGFDAQTLQDGDEQLRERQFFRFDLTPPPSITDDACASLIVFVAPAEFQITTVGETQVLTAG